MRNPKPAVKPGTRSVPKEAQDELWRQVQDFATASGLEFYLRGRHIYIYQRDEPLCRLDYTGSLEEWEMAIYKYSKSAYSKDEFGVRSRGAPRALLESALRFYSLWEQPLL